MPTNAAERRAEHRALERHRDEVRPAVERPAADVHRPRDHLRPVLEAVAARAAEDAADQHDQRQRVPLEAERVVQLLDRKGRIRVHRGVAFEARAIGRHDEIRRVVEFGHQAVERRGGVRAPSSHP